MMSAGDSDGGGGDRPATVVPFPVPDEERARRVKAEVERQARLSPGEYLLYLDDTAKKYGVDKAVLKAMIEAVSAENEKKRRGDQAEQRRIEQRVEKKRTAKEREERAGERERERAVEREDRRARRDAREQLAAERRAQQRQREIDRQLAIILKQPIAEHDSRLIDVATRLGEDVNDLRAQFAGLLDIERERRGIGDVEPWPEPVNLNALLDDIHKHRRRFIIIHDEHGAVTATLWTAFSWVHQEISTHSPPLLITSADDEGNAAKTLLCKYLQYQTPRGKVVGELSGASFFHMIDRVHPTLIIDNDEFLVQRRKFARFALDNAEALRAANPAVPKGFDNRLRANWRLLFAIADLAGGSWPKRIRAAVVQLTKQYYEPSIGRQCLGRLVELFPASEYEGMVTSAWAQEQFTSDPTAIWANYKGRGPITQWGIKDILSKYHISPNVIHPRGRAADRGYKIEWFEVAFRHYLHVEVADILEQWREQRKKTKK